MRRLASYWIEALLVIGAALALTLLVQTVNTYRYVSNTLVQQEASRATEEIVRVVERAMRSGAMRDIATTQALLDDVRAERPERLAALAIRRLDGTIVAASGGVTVMASPIRFSRDTVPVRDIRGGRAVLVDVRPCQCAIRQTGREQSGRESGGRFGGPPERVVAEVALFVDGLSTPFSSLRRNALVSLTAAVALLAAVSIIALRFGPYVRGKQLQEQMEVARQVQRKLLPEKARWPAGIDVGAKCLSASRVGGDFFDIVALAPNRVSFVVGDVSGHGVPAALLVGLINGAMSSPPWGVIEDETARAGQLNELLLTKSSGNRFASLFWCVYDEDSGVLRYLNAGQLPPFWVHSIQGQSMVVSRLDSRGPVLGLLADAQYRTASVSATAGDLIVLFSDGIVEATNPAEEYFGEDRLIAIVRACAALPAPEICDAILAAVRAFEAGGPAKDDQTLLVARLPPPGRGRA